MKRKKIFEKLDQQFLRKATLVFLLRENAGKPQVLLAMKKRGFAVGKYNGVGGKVDEKNRETIEQAAKRETLEEISVNPESLEKVAVLRFFFPHLDQKLDWNQEVHVFLVKKWSGQPAESEEMRPEWFGVDQLPFAQMWVDDPLWLPRVLAGEKLTATFVFGKETSLLENYEVLLGLD